MFNADPFHVIMVDIKKRKNILHTMNGWDANLQQFCIAVRVAQCGLRAGCGFPAVAGLLGWLLGEYESSEPWPWPRIKQCWQCPGPGCTTARGLQWSRYGNVSRLPLLGTPGNMSCQPTVLREISLCDCARRKLKLGPSLVESAY